MFLVTKKELYCVFACFAVKPCALGAVLTKVNYYWLITCPFDWSVKRSLTCPYSKQRLHHTSSSTKPIVVTAYNSPLPPLPIMNYRRPHNVTLSSFGIVEANVFKFLCGMYVRPVYLRRPLWEAVLCYIKCRVGCHQVHRLDQSYLRCDDAMSGAYIRVGRSVPPMPPTGTLISFFAATRRCQNSKLYRHTHTHKTFTIWI